MRYAWIAIKQSAQRLQRLTAKAMQDIAWSCGLCKGMTPKRSMKCPDSWDTCPKMAKEGNCHHETYRVNCCISCKSNPDETEEEKEKRLCRDDYDIGREKKFCPV